MNEKIIHKFTNLCGQREYIKKNLQKKENKLNVLKKKHKYIEEAQILLQVTAQETQNNLKIHLEDIVQIAINTCFPGEYKFSIEFELKRGSTICEMYIIDCHGYKINPLNSAGGGVVDIISIALRLAVWSLSKPDNVIILDEPFKFLSSNLHPLAVEILSNLSKKLKLQIIIITHNSVIIDIADSIFEVKKNKKGISKVKCINKKGE